MPWALLGNLLAGIGGWHLLDWFKPKSETKQDGFASIERLIALVGIGILIYHFVFRRGRRF